MNDQVLLVHSEQGLGDAILFASCLPELQSRCAKVIVETPVRLARLFRRSFPWADVVGHEQTDNSSGWLGSHASVQRQIPIGSLPFHFRKTNEDFPSRAGYLLADPQAVADWRCKISDGQRRTIGISWRGGLALTAKFQRSLELETLARALATMDVALVNLQYGETDSEIQQLAKATGIELHPGLSGLADLDDLAALTSACDGVITVCSTLAHLAGALGMPGLVLVPTIANWRYGAGGTRSVWYPNLELARQSAEGDWNGPLIRARGWAEQLQSAAGMHPAQAE
jgi:ADP-heptose:LPS heptosyltransferase